MANPILTEFKRYAKWGATNFMALFNVKAYDEVTQEGIQDHLHDIRNKTGTAIGGLENKTLEMENEIRLLKAKGIFRGTFQDVSDILSLPHPKSGDYALLESGVTGNEIYEQYIWDGEWDRAGKTSTPLVLDYASQQEATDGAVNDKIMTPLRSKQAMDVELDKKENKFSKNSAFNKSFSHAINSTSKVLVASAYAVRLAYNKGAEALTKANSNTKQIENLSIEKVLFDTTLKTTGVTKNLIESYSNYKYLEIYGAFSGSLGSVSSRATKIMRKIRVADINNVEYEYNLGSTGEEFNFSFPSNATIRMDSNSASGTNNGIYKIIGRNI